MKRNRFPRWAGPPLAVLLMVVLAGCPPPEQPDAEPPVDTEAERERIEALLDEVRAGVTAQDWNRVDPHLTDDWEILGDGERMSWAEQRALFEDHLTEHRSEFRDVEVTVSDDGSMAWAKFEEETEFRFDGQPVQQEALFTAVFHRVDGEWRMAHLHRSTPMPQPED